MKRITPIGIAFALAALVIVASGAALGAATSGNSPPRSGGGSGAVSSVGAGAGCVTISPTTGAVVVTSSGCVNAAGVAGGQTIVGGTASGEGLTISTTSHATKGAFTIGSSAGLVYNESTTAFSVATSGLYFDPTDGFVGIGTTTTNFEANAAGTHGLSIMGATTSQAVLELKRSTASSTGGIVGGLYWFNGVYDVADIQVFNQTGAPNSGRMVFTTNNAGSDLSRLEISADGQFKEYNSAFASFTSSGTQIVQTGGRIFEIATTPPTLASGASITLDAIRVDPITTTFTGTTGVTTAAGVNLVDIEAGTLTDASALTITNAATVAIKAAPIAAGSVTITNGYALWVQAGATRIDGPIVLTNTLATPGSGIIVTTDAPSAVVSLSLKYIQATVNGVATYILALQ